MYWSPDHEAVSALLRVSPNRGDGTLSGAMGDISSRRPTHMAEDAVRAVKLLLMSKMVLNLHIPSSFALFHLVPGWRRTSACECGSEVESKRTIFI